MTKQDVLSMQSKYDIMKTLKTQPELWDDEINEHLKAVARQYLMTTYGDESILVDLFQNNKKSPDS